MSEQEITGARVVIVNAYHQFDGGSIFDGLSPEAAETVTAFELEDEVKRALSEAHLAAWKELLQANGFEPMEIGEWEIDTEVARGHGFSRNQIVDWEELGHESDPYWQQAWDRVDSGAIVDRVLAGHFSTLAAEVDSGAVEQIVVAAHDPSRDEIVLEDSGLHAIVEIEALDESPLQVRLHSEDEGKQHTLIKALAARKFRVVIEFTGE